MSYILDALKKIEHEKNKKRSDGRVGISGDLFHERSKPVAKAGIWKIALLLVAVSLIACAATWFVLRGSGTKRSPVISQVALLPTPAISVPVAIPVIPAPVQSLPAPVAASPKNIEAVADGDSAERSVQRSKKRIKAEIPSPKQPAQTVQAPADVKLSGIAWQDERAGRRAVINGFLLKEGAVVSGAKIIDIQADRVRFLSSAGQFEIKLDAVLPSEVKR